MKTKLLWAVFTAAVLWFVMFSPWTSHYVSFWWAMTCSGLLLSSMALVFGGFPPTVFSGDGGRRSASLLMREVLLGLGIAVVLWGLFWVGDKLSQQLFSFARPQVDLIYDMKSNFSASVIALLLLFIIGPAEELFWRGYIQRTLSSWFSPNVGFLLSTVAYTLVHLPSGNFMLIMAALTCGVLWGGLYRLMPRHFLAIVLSHALWDAAAFVWFPF